MRKILACALAMVFILAALAGCAAAPAQTDTPQTGADTPQAGADTPAAPAEPEGEKRFKIGLTMSERDQWLSGMEAAIVAAAEANNCDLVAFDSQASVEKQLEHIQTFATGGYDMVIINLVDTNTGEDMINLMGWDIPLVFVDRRPEDALLEEDLRCYVGATEYLAGQYQAEWLAEHFKDDEDKVLDVVIFKGRLGLENTEQRTLGAVETLEKAGFTVNKVFEDTANYDRATAVDKMATFLGTGKTFDLIISNNDEMALGAIEAMELADMDPSLTPIVGIDGTEMGLEAIKNGKMSATAFQDPKQVGETCFKQAYDMLTTGKMSIYEDVPFILVTKENLDQFLS